MLFRDYSGVKILESVHHCHPGNGIPFNLELYKIAKFRTSGSWCTPGKTQSSDNSHTNE